MTDSNIQAARDLSAAAARHTVSMINGRIDRIVDAMYDVGDEGPLYVAIKALREVAESHRQRAVACREHVIAIAQGHLLDQDLIRIDCAPAPFVDGDGYVETAAQCLAEVTDLCDAAMALRDLSDTIDQLKRSMEVLR